MKSIKEQVWRKYKKITGSKYKIKSEDINLLMDLTEQKTKEQDKKEIIIVFNWIKKEIEKKLELDMVKAKIMFRYGELDKIIDNALEQLKKRLK